MRCPRLVALCLALAGCRCLEAVDDCGGSPCQSRDGGRDGGRDAGVDGGVDAGADGGALTACAVWDGGGVGPCAAITGYVFQGTQCWGECVGYPIVTPGVFPDLRRCLSCGCDTAKLTTFPRGGVVSPAAYCDELFARTVIPRLIDEAFPGLDAGACRPVGAVDWECPLWRRFLGDAGYDIACQATLIPRVTEVQCRVWL